jgi:hypothetical protein
VSGPLNRVIATSEYWVMRVLAPREAVAAWSKRASPGQVATLQARIDDGQLVYVGGELCEPIEVFNNQEDAITRASKEHARTGVVHKVVLNAEM